MAKSVHNKFAVGFFIKQWVEADIIAPTLEDAIKIGRTMQIEEVLRLDTNINDSSIKVIQAYDKDFEI